MKQLKRMGSSYRIFKDTDADDLELRFLEATYQAHLTVMEQCIKQGVDPNVTDDDDYTGLHHAAVRGDIPMARVLHAAPGIQVDKADPSGHSPLMLACIYCHEEFVKVILEMGANPNLMNDRQQRPLHMAVTVNSTKIALLLLKYGANINVRDVFDNSPVSIAVIDRGTKRMTSFLLRRGANATKTKQFPLFLECILNCNSQERLEIIDLLLSYGVDIYCLHPVSKRTCLHYVGITGYLPAAKFLVKRGEANLQVRDLTNRTPADVAWDHRNIEVYNYFTKWLERIPLMQELADEILENVFRLFELD